MSQQSRSRAWVYVLFIGLFVLAGLPLAGQQAAQATTSAQSKPRSAAPIVRTALHHATSRAVRDLPTLVNDANFQAQALKHVPSPLRPFASSRTLAPATAGPVADATIQRGAPLAAAGPLVPAPPVSLSFDGLGGSAPGFTVD